MNILKDALATFQSVMLNITFWDILDVAIIAFLIYKIVTAVSKTNSANVVKGIVLVLVALGLSSILQLKVINFLLGQAFELGIIALLVLFQPEIRRFLEQVGNSTIKNIFSKKESNQDIDAAITQTVIAYTDLSKEKTGALIVFERGMRLDNYLKTGTIVDAAPSAELIKNIFFENTPLHDGAVIVRGGRIAAASCMLPLSNNPNLSRELGMRHRAGIGMSENSDAVIAVVSEETGAISVAIGGMLKRHLSTETLDKLLRKELMPDEEPQDRMAWFKDITKNLHSDKKDKVEK